MDMTDITKCDAECVNLINSTKPSQVNDTSTDDGYFYYPDFCQIPLVRAIFMFLFITECLLGVIGNLLVSLVVYKNTYMHSHVNYYIVNLAVCDFLVGSFVLPMKLYELMADADTNIMNNFWCTTFRFLESVIVFASVFTLVAICIERYYAIVHPVLSRVNMTSGRIRRVILLVWLIPILCASPSLYPAQSEPHRLASEYGKLSIKICHDEFPPEVRRGYFLFLFIFIYIIPLVFISVTCVSIMKTLMQKIPMGPHTDSKAIRVEKGRRKVAKMILVVVLAFVLCWSPYFIITAITQVHNFFDQSQFIFTMLVINLLAFTNSCINPIVYFCMSARFRKGLVLVMKPVFSRVGYKPTIEIGLSTFRSSNTKNSRQSCKPDKMKCDPCNDENRIREDCNQFDGNSVNQNENSVCPYLNIIPESLDLSTNPIAESCKHADIMCPKSIILQYGKLTNNSAQFYSQINTPSHENLATAVSKFDKV